jgi:hypothetical protein
MDPASVRFVPSNHDRVTGVQHNRGQRDLQRVCSRRTDQHSGLTNRVIARTGQQQAGNKSCGKSWACSASHGQRISMVGSTFQRHRLACSRSVATSNPHQQTAGERLTVVVSPCSAPAHYRSCNRYCVPLSRRCGAVRRWHWPQGKSLHGQTQTVGPCHGTPTRFHAGASPPLHCNITRREDSGRSAPVSGRSSILSSKRKEEFAACFRSRLAATEGGCTLSWLRLRRAASPQSWWPGVVGLLLPHRPEACATGYSCPSYSHHGTERS